MDAYYALGKFFTIFGVIVQGIVLCLQVSALLRHNRGFFALLCISSLCLLMEILLIGVSYFLPVSDSVMMTLNYITIPFALVGSSLGILGMLLLLRSYRRLSEALGSDVAANL